MALYKLIPAGSGLGPFLLVPVLLVIAPPYLLGGARSDAVLTTAVVIVVATLVFFVAAVVRWSARLGTAALFSLLVLMAIWLLGAGARSEVSNGLRQGAVGEWNQQQLDDHIDAYGTPATYDPEAVEFERYEVLSEHMTAMIDDEIATGMGYALAAAVIMLVLGGGGMVADAQRRRVAHALAANG